MSLNCAARERDSAMRLVVTGCDCRISGRHCGWWPASAGAPAHGLEEVRHAVRIEAGGGEEADADAVGFVFVGAREVDLLLHGRALRHGDAAQRGVARAGGRADRMAARMAAIGRDALAALRADAARDVPLRDVRDFVRQHAGELRFVARGEHQPVVHADEAAGQREGVDGAVAHEEEVEALRGIAAWPGRRCASRAPAGIRWLPGPR